MKYQLDTIPVWDALKEDTECPLCALRRKNERMYVESFLGASVMEPLTRVEVNEKGFCVQHNAQMFAEKNRLELALITHTYMQEVNRSVEEILRNSKSGAGAFPRLFGGNTSSTEDVPGQIEKRIGGCVLCERLETTLNRYAYTLAHLWAHDREFQEAFEASRGLCLPDMALVLRMAKQSLNHAEYTKFSAALGVLQKENLQRVEKELEWFTLKFDYRNQDKPWGNSRDAVERALQKLKGFPKGRP